MRGLKPYLQNPGCAVSAETRANWEGVLYCILPVGKEPEEKGKDVSCGTSKTLAGKPLQQRRNKKYQRTDNKVLGHTILTLIFATQAFHGAVSVKKKFSRQGSHFPVIFWHRDNLRQQVSACLTQL